MTRHVIDNSFQKYHDQAVGDLDNDGEDEILVPSQLAKVLVYYDVPSDPTVSPWPKECRHLICENISVEGLAIVDLDGDGKTRLLQDQTFSSLQKPRAENGRGKFLENYMRELTGGSCFLKLGFKQQI